MQLHSNINERTESTDFLQPLVTLKPPLLPMIGLSILSNSDSSPSTDAIRYWTCPTLESSAISLAPVGVATTVLVNQVGAKVSCALSWLMLSNLSDITKIFRKNIIIIV